MRVHTAASATLLLLTACAGGPIAIKSDPNAKEVTVFGTSYIVAPTGPNTFAAVHKNFLANNLAVSNADLLPRAAAFKAAIEMATGCRVTEAMMDQTNMTLQALVSCAPR